MFRRRPQDPVLERIREHFAGVAAAIDVAQRSLLAAIPTSRDPGVPLAQALAAFARSLDRAALSMPQWRDPAVEDEWRRCSDALDQARQEAEQLRLGSEDLGFEALNARIGDVLDPLDVFADTERGLRRRR